MGMITMEQQPRIETLTKKKLVGQNLKMTLTGNRTGELWRNFMSRRREIKNKLSTEMISMQVYDESLDFRDFNQHTEFEKWAAIEVTDFDNTPAGMKTFLLEGGLYAVFTHRGSSTDNSTFQYIFTTWLPNSNYLLDNRPHFEILGDKYINNDPGSEEEIWTPIRARELANNRPQ